MSKARAKKIKLILFDVDGVLTDGTIWLVPGSGGTHGSKQPVEGNSIASSSIVEAKGFHAHDGVGISLARIGGIKTGIITRRQSETVALRGRDLKIDHILQGQVDKNAALDQILKSEGLSSDEAAFMGDDIVDLPAMRRCGLAISVPNAREEVKDESHFITDREGGQGAARDAVEYILRAQGRLDEVVNAYLENRPLQKR
jgi:3-deoxy-D-manno-octulosonate 8-phosphate phosphatase (KDO 8-P phosphatase)